MTISKHKQTLIKATQAEEIQHLIFDAIERAKTLPQSGLSPEGKSVKNMPPIQLTAFRKLQGYGWSWNCQLEEVVEVYNSKQKGKYIRLEKTGAFQRSNKSINKKGK